MTLIKNYTFYLSIAFDLEPWNPLVHNTIVWTSRYRISYAIHAYYR